MLTLDKEQNKKAITFHLKTWPNFSQLYRFRNFDKNVMSELEHQVSRLSSGKKQIFITETR